MAQSFSPGYLGLSLLLLAVALALLRALPARRRLMLTSGLLSAPFAFYSPFFVPDYWQPQRMLVLITGLEDVIFSFANGVIVFGLTAWIAAPLPGRPGRFLPKLARFLLPCLVAAPVVAGLIALGLGVMSATLLAGVGVWAFCLYQSRGRAGLLSLAGGISFAVFYWGVVRLILLLFPEMRSWWVAEGLGRVWLLGVPLGEVLWALFYGATWPLFMGWSLGWRRDLPIDK